MNKNTIFSILSIFGLTTLISYPVNASKLQKDADDLERRQKIVCKQLEEHQRLNKKINNPQATLYGAIQQAQKEEDDDWFYDNLYASQKYGAKFGSIPPLPGSITTPEVISLLDLNKQANAAKHKW